MSVAISSSKAPFSFRLHIVPPLIGLLFFSLTLLGLNAPWIIKELEYYFSKPIANYSTINKKQLYKNSEIIIPSINVRAPIVFDSSANNNIIFSELRNGVVHYAHTAMPGQIGNSVIFGHSSGVLWEKGNYKFVFTLLHDLKPNNIIYINYNGQQYRYRVINTVIVKPTTMSVLNQTKTPMLSLITCTPVGYSTNRFVVHAVQYSPNPKLDKPNNLSSNKLDINSSSLILPSN